MSESIVREYLNLNLISGSSEKLRTLMEQSWEVVSSSEGEILEFNGNVDYFEGDGTTGRIAYELNKIESGAREEITGSTILSSFRIPVRMYGNEDYFSDSYEWVAFVRGGSANGISYKGFYNENIYFDHYISCEVPYGNYEASILGKNDDTGYQKIKINPVYNYYLKEYEAAIDLTANLEIPNIYFFQMAVDTEDSTEIAPIDANILNYITRENELGNLMEFGEALEIESAASTLLSSTKHEMLPPEESLFTVESSTDDGGATENLNVDTNYNLRNYLTGAYITGPLSASTTTSIIAMSQNQIFDDTACQNYLKDNSTILTNRSLFPYYMNIEIPADYASSDTDSTTFREQLSDNGFIQGFISNLQETFSELDTATDSELNCVSNISYKTGSEDSSIVSSIVESEEVFYRMVDYVDFLSIAIDKAATSEKGAGKTFIGEKLFPVKAIVDGGPAHDFYNHYTAMNTFDSVLDYINLNPFNIDSLEQLYAYAETSKYYEIMAYRIHKQSSAGATISNYWIYNDPDLGDTLTLTDTQVRYNDAYTYTVYMYKLIYGLKYKFSNAVVAESIAIKTDTSEDDEDSESLESLSVCVQFKKVAGGAPSDMLYGESSYEGTFSSQTLETVAVSDMYMADLYLNYEPSIKIVEIPLYSKTLKVLDNPASTLDVVPYQLLDNSRTIGFKVKTETFSKGNMPSIINSNDEEYIKEYINSKDMLSTDKISLSSRSSDTTIEAYRLEEKPNSISNFSNNLLKTYNLSLSNEKGTNTFIKCEDIIQTNKKYYYLFRALNEHGIAGHSTEIYETELINDGGYNYVNFTSLTEKDLEEDVFVNPIRTFKKLINIKPNLEQIELDDSEVDYTQPSYTQLDALQVGSSDVDDSIWNKTFKLRLTSKKTGKKIDLNITYNVSNG
tara:strand:- start:3611 stop:6325 length:2715 start_codon:yes stop_codon:yes gene_type:complete